MKPATILKRARKLIEKPGSWCQLAEARTRDGESISCGDSMATQFCALGAIWRATGQNDDAPTKFLREAVGARYTLAGPKSVANWNDAPRRTHKQILKAFDKAIALAEKEGAR